MRRIYTLLNYRQRIRAASPDFVPLLALAILSFIKCHTRSVIELPPQRVREEIEGAVAEEDG